MEFLSYSLITVILGIIYYLSYAVTNVSIIPRKLSDDNPKGWQAYSFVEETVKMSAIISDNFINETDKPVIFFIHGFPDIASTWRKQLELTGHGYRLIAPTLKGYEPSTTSIQKGNVFLETMAEDLKLWLRHFQIPSAHFVGHDWGSAIIYVACIRDPSICKSMSLVAVPPLILTRKLFQYPKQWIFSLYMLFFQLPYLPEAVLQYDDWRGIELIYSFWSPGMTSEEEHINKVKDALSQENVLSSALQYYRSNLFSYIFPGVFNMQNLTDILLTEDLSIPTLAISGENDNCILTNLFEDICKIFKEQVIFHRIMNAGHFVHIEKPETFNRILINFLKTNQVDLDIPNVLN